MSYSKAAEYINQELKKYFHTKEIIQYEAESLLNIMIELGRVAKYRCRMNTAYKSFLTECFKDIAKVKEKTVEREFGKPFTVFKAEITDR